MKTKNKHRLVSEIILLKKGLSDMEELLLNLFDRVKNIENML